MNIRVIGKNKIKIFLIFLLAIVSKSYSYSIEYRYHYTTPLCLHLVKGEMASFFTKAQSTTEEECCKAIDDYIALWRRNSDSPRGVLHSLKYHLEHRISSIEYQLEHKNRFNYVDLAIGAALGAASLALLYVVYYYYKNSYVKNNTDYVALVEKLATKGITVHEWPREIHLSGNNAYLYSESGRKLAQYANDNENLFSGLLLGCGGSATCAILSMGGLYNGLHPDHDNQYLSKYKNLLQYINDQIKSKNLSEDY